MEMAEYREDGIWEVVPTDTEPLPAAWPEAERTVGRTVGPNRVVGWSLVCLVGANAALLAIVVFVGMSPVGLVACAGMALSSWLLVVAELLSLHSHSHSHSQSDEEG